MSVEVKKKLKIGFSFLSLISGIIVVYCLISLLQLFIGVHIPILGKNLDIFERLIFYSSIAIISIVSGLASCFILKKE